ncbi:MAG: F0F1 ATP synthase subunit alpha, partial [Verrucomicrobia bacterium]|nr:F0F1 ATP synthase subunit alpha [Verrucomicrobiota bacterium]
AQYRELAAFSQFGSDLDPQTTARLERGKRITELFKQDQHAPMPVAIQVIILWSVQNGIMDDIPVNKIRKFAADFTEHLSLQKAPLLKKINDQKKLDDALIAEIKTAAESYRGTWKE